MPVLVCGSFVIWTGGKGLPRPLTSCWMPARWASSRRSVTLGGPPLSCPDGAGDGDGSKISASRRHSVLTSVPSLAAAEVPSGQTR